MTKRQVGIVYTILSAIALVPLVLIQTFSVFLFDDPSHQTLAVVIALGILLMPIILVVGNVCMWIFIKRDDKVLMTLSILVPIMYPVLFFLTWALLGS